MASITRLGQYGGPAAVMAGSVYADYGEGPPSAAVDTGAISSGRKKNRFFYRMLIPFALLLLNGCVVTTYRTTYCDLATIYVDSITRVPDSMKYTGCEDARYEGKVIDCRFFTCDPQTEVEVW